MTELPVDGICFRFDDRWEVVKWDESSWYLEKIARLQGSLDGKVEGTKAVDLIGVRGDAGRAGRDVAYLMEVKDFRGFEIENRQRHLAELPLELGLKARDTVAGVLGLVSLGNPPALALRWLDAVRANRVHVVTWIAEDPAPPRYAHKRSVRDDERLQRVRQKLSWLTARVWVADPLGGSELAGVSATSEAGAGVARRS